MLKENIIAKMKDLSSSQLKIARFILDHPREAPFMTASEMGEKINVSESTVIRFANAMGYKGYPDLKDAMKSLLLDRMTTIERMNLYESDGNSSSHRFMKFDLLDLQEAYTTVDQVEIDRLAGYITKSPALYIAAQRSSKSLAYYLSFYLSWFIPVVEVLDESSVFEKLSTSPKGSILTAITFPRYSRWTLEVLRKAHQLNLKTAIISDSRPSPLAGTEPDFKLTIPCRHISFIDSLTPAISLMSCLIISVADQLGDKARDQLEKLEAIWEEEGTYFS